MAVVRSTRSSSVSCGAVRACGLGLLTVYLVLLARRLLHRLPGQSSGRRRPVRRRRRPPRSPRVGRSIFEWLVVFMLAARAVPRARLDLRRGRRRARAPDARPAAGHAAAAAVRSSPASSARRCAFLALLVVATAPAAGVAYLVGGVTITNVLVAVAHGAVHRRGRGRASALSASAMFRRVQAATVVAYAVVLVHVRRDLRRLRRVPVIIDAIPRHRRDEPGPAAARGSTRWSSRSTWSSTRASAESGPPSAFDRLVSRAGRGDLLERVFAEEAGARRSDRAGDRLRRADRRRRDRGRRASRIGFDDVRQPDLRRTTFRRRPAVLGRVDDRLCRWSRARRRSSSAPAAYPGECRG